MEKRTNHKAWLFVLPVVLSVAFTAVIPLIMVVNYSVQDIFGPFQRVFVGREWFQDVLRDEELRAAFFRTLLFSTQVLIIEIPLGIAVALALPAKGWRSSLSLVLVALPLLIPWNVVGTIWQIFGRADIGLGGYFVNKVVGLDYNYASDSLDAWLTVLLMDVWHWTPLVVLLCYAGLRAIPEAYYQAARIDAAKPWAVFRYIQLPKLSGVLMIAVLLRFMDSFLIYTEPFVVTGGGPGNATTFLSIFLAKIAVGQFDLGPAAAFSLIYFLIIQILCFVFYTVLQNIGKGVSR
ncbi:sugar ABC transporter permease [soil metagenome]